jgi:hypothetical protein
MEDEIMRDNSDFLKDLRSEIETSQQRRANFVKMKLGAIIGIFGLGSIKINNIPTTFILFLVPLIVLVFDLFIIGEDFGVKRAGRFILDNPAAPDQEQRWERTVRDNRDPASGLANLIASTIFLIISALFLWHVDIERTLFFWIWLAISFLLLLNSWIYSQILIRKLWRLNNYLSKN